jgi:hypothetical protein
MQSVDADRTIIQPQTRQANARGRNQIRADIACIAGITYGVVINAILRSEGASSVGKAVESISGHIRFLFDCFFAGYQHVFCDPWSKFSGDKAENAMIGCAAT